VPNKKNTQKGGWSSKVDNSVLNKRKSTPIDADLKHDSTKVIKRNYNANSLTPLQSQKQLEIDSLLKTKNIKNKSEDVRLIPVENIILMDYKDRPTDEVGDLKSLSDSIKHNGQQVPAIVRLRNDGNYELVAGYRRWLACKSLNNRPLLSWVRKLNNKEAISVQHEENKNRKNLSSWALAKHYKNLLDANYVGNKTELSKTLNITTQKLSRILSFFSIPSPVINKIGEKNMKNISMYTAEKIKQLCEKGEAYINAILLLCPQIAEGKIGSTSISDRVEKIISPKTRKNNILGKININNKAVVIWNETQNGSTIKFSKKALLKLNDESKKKLASKILRMIEKEMNI
jgi:ParB family transcriptional regulator, chromosome partitioning protein